MIDFDIELIKKYNKSGPRYTSYPTAPYFNESFTHKDFLREIKRSNAESNLPDLSLYFHIPFCDTLCYFCGCNMLITHNRDRIKNYIAYVKKEIDLLRSVISEDRKVTQLHWGGGTPTYLYPDEISDLINYINSRFDFKSTAEVACEVDPRGLTKDHLAALREGGFNRISMGVQDFNVTVQKAVNRLQSEEITRQVVAWVRDLNFESTSIDLMYGLPHQTLADFEKTINTIIDISPDRLSVFNYGHVPWLKKHMALIKDTDLPNPEEKLDIFKMTVEKLVATGYNFIGMDHFAKPDDEMVIALNQKKLYRNFQGYSTNAGVDLYGIGISSIGQLDRCYVQNHKVEKEYFKALDNNHLPTIKGYLLNADDLLRRHVIMALMCDLELHFAPIEQKFNINFEDYFNEELNSLTELINDGLVSLENRKLTVSNKGRFLIRNIAIHFDGYIKAKQNAKRYSKTI